MNNLCKSKINCDDPNPPTGAFSSEATDQVAQYSRFQMFLPPALGANWTSSNRVGMCAAPVQDDADVCAMQDFMTQAAANNSAPPKCLLPVPPDVPCEDDSALFKNTPQTCVGTCPDGLPFSFTVRAGRFTAFSANTANAMAFSYACDQIIQNRVCIGRAPTTEGCVNTIFGITVDCQANFGPLVFKIVSGSLPPGLALSSAGPLTFSIAGIPTTVGDFSFLLQATDTHGNFMQKRLVLSIVGITNEATLPQATNGTPYSSQLVIGATTSGVVTWSISAGSLPAGLTLSQTGVISGTPTTNGTSAFTVQISDANTTCSKAFSLQVQASAPPVTCVDFVASIATGSIAFVDSLIASDAAGDRLLMTGYDVTFNFRFRRMIKISDASLISEVSDDSVSGAFGAYAPSVSRFMFRDPKPVPFNAYRFAVVNLAHVVVGFVDLSTTNAVTMGFGLNGTTVYESTTDSFYVLGRDNTDHLECVKINPSTLAFTEIFNVDPNIPFHSFSNSGFMIASPDFIWFDYINAICGIRLSTNALTAFIPAAGGFSGTGCYATNTGKLYIPTYNEITFNPEVWEITPGTNPVVSHVYAGLPRAAMLVYDETQGRIIGQPNDFGDNGFVIDPVSQTVVCTPALPQGNGGNPSMGMAGGKLYLAASDGSLQLWS